MINDPVFRSLGAVVEKRRPSGMTVRVLLLALTTLGWAAAGQAPPAILERFDLSKDGGVQERLPSSLREVSGLARTSGGRVFAHNDERAVIYEVDPTDGHVVKAFSAGIGGVRGDFEGIAAVDDRLFLVTSGGELLETREGEDGSALAYSVHETRLGRLCEIEGLAFDPRTRSLLLPCKGKKAEELKNHVVVFSVELETLRVRAVPRVFFPFEELDEIGLEDSFHPSAVEVHPTTGRIILVSAQEETILELSPYGALLGGRELHRKTHPQPEGVTFLDDGSLLLADEGQGGRGHLTRYPVREPEGEGFP